MPDYCGNFLTIEGSQEILKQFIEENTIDGSLSFEKGVSANLTEDDITGEGWYDKQIISWGTNSDIIDDAIKCGWINENKITFSYKTAWTPASFWQMFSAINYPELIFTNFFDEPNSMFCGFDISIKGDSFKFMTEIESDYILLKELIEQSKNLSFPETIRILLEFNSKRDIKKNKKFIKNFEEFSKKLFRKTFEYLHFKDLSDINEFKAFVMNYASLSLSKPKSVIDIFEVADLKKKKNNVKKDFSLNKQNVKKEMSDTQKQKIAKKFTTFVNGSSNYD